VSDPPPSPLAPRAATLTVAVFTALQLLNFIDRYAPSAVKDLFKADLSLTDQQTGLVFSAFVLVYMVACPVFGTLAERGNRPRLLALGVAGWSLATAGAAFANDFASLMVARALVGIGEAAFITISPTMIADLYAPEKRNRILTIINAATPIGVAIGFSLAGLFGQWWGWRTAFVVVGLPGLLLAVVALWLPDPMRGRFDEDDANGRTPPAWSGVLKGVSANRRYLFATAGYIAMTFALGGIGDWVPTLLSRERGFSLGEAGTVAGLSVVVGGLIGTVVGGALSEVLRGKVREPLFVVCGVSCVPGALLAAWAVLIARGPTEIAVALALAQVFLWMFNGPVNALVVNALDAGVRARGFGLALLLTHLLGDVISPPIIGRVASATGSVAQGIVVALVAAVLAGVVWLVGALSVSSRPASS
jgi:MFS transporter, Spinster family, sphingosine-1-phosphate transporter